MKIMNLIHLMVKKFVLIVAIANISLPLYAYQENFYDPNRPPIPRILNPPKATSNPIASPFVTPVASSPIPQMETTAADALPVSTNVNEKMEITVSVPIQLPTGTANNTPQLALHYNDKRSHIYTGDTANPRCFIRGRITGDSKKQCFAKRFQNDNVKWAQSPTQNSLFKSAIKNGNCYKQIKFRWFYPVDPEWQEVKLSNNQDENLKQCYNKHEQLQRRPARFPRWWYPTDIVADYKWASTFNSPPVWERNDVDNGSAEPTLWSMKGVPSVQKCQTISAPQSSLCLVDGQYETELQKVSMGTQSKIHYRLMIEEQPQNSIHVVADANSLSIHNHVSGEVLLFNKSQRLNNTFTLSQSYTLPFKKNVITYHWLPMNRATHGQPLAGQLHGYQLSHILYGVNYASADPLSLKNEEVYYNHKVEFKWFEQRATGYPQNIIVHSKVLVDGRHDGNNFTEVFRYGIFPNHSHSMISPRHCLSISAYQDAAAICPQTVIAGDVLTSGNDLNFHNIGFVRKKVPEDTHDNQSQLAYFMYQGCTANHLGGCLTGVISGPTNKQWSHKINFNDSSPPALKKTRWQRRKSDARLRIITRTQSTNTGDVNTPMDTGIIRQTQWGVQQSDKLPSGNYSHMNITDEWDNNATQKRIQNDLNGNPTLINTTYFSPELGNFPRERIQHIQYNSQGLLTKNTIFENQQINATNHQIQNQSVTHYRYKSINISDIGVSESIHTEVAIPERISVIENLGPQGAGQNFIPNIQRIREIEWAYTDSNPNQYKLEAFVCQRDNPLTGPAMNTRPKHRHCANNTRVSSTDITGLKTDSIDDDNNNTRALQIKDTINKQISKHQYSVLGLLREHKAVDDSNHHNALSNIVTTYDVNSWRVSQISTNNSPYMQLLDEYTLDGTASLQKTFYGDFRQTDSKKLSHTKHQINPLTLAINRQKLFAKNGIDILSDISTQYVRPSHDGTSANIGFKLTDNIDQNTTQQVYNVAGQMTSVSNKDASGDIEFMSTRQYFSPDSPQGLLHATRSQIGTGAATVSALTYNPSSLTTTSTQGDKSLTKILSFIPYGNQSTSTNSDGQTFTVQTTPLRLEFKDKDNNTRVISTAYWKTCLNVPDRAFRVTTVTLIKVAGSESKTLSKQCFDTRDNLLYDQTENDNVTLYKYYPNNRLEHKEDCQRNGTNLTCSKKETYHYYTDKSTDSMHGLIGQLRNITNTSKPHDLAVTNEIESKVRYEYDVSEGGHKGRITSQTTFIGNSDDEYIKEEYNEFDDIHGPKQVEYTFAFKDQDRNLVEEKFKFNLRYYQSGDYKHQLERITYPNMIDNPVIRPSTTLSYINEGTTDTPRHRLDTSKLSVNGKDINVYDYDGTFAIPRSRDLSRHKLATGRLTDSASRDINTRLVNDATSGTSMWFRHIAPKGDALSSGNYLLHYNTDHGKLKYRVVDGKIRRHEQWDNKSKIAEFRYGYTDEQQLRTVTQKQYQDIQHHSGSSNVIMTDTQTYHYSQGNITNIDINQPSNTPTDSTTHYEYDGSGRLSKYKNHKDRNLKRLDSVSYRYSGQVSTMNFGIPSNGKSQHMNMTYYSDNRVKNVSVTGDIEGDRVNINTRYIYGANDKVAITVEDIDLGDKCDNTGIDKKQQKISFEIAGLYKWVRYTDKCHTNTDRILAYHYLPSGHNGAQTVLREGSVDQRNHNRHYVADLLAYQYDMYGSVVAQSGPDMNKSYAEKSHTNSLLLRQYFTPYGKRVITEDRLPTQEHAITDGQLARQVRLNYHGIDVTGGLSNHREISGTELLNMGDYRLYAPDIGRFINPDDRDFPELGADGYNRYMYAMNNPVRYVDLDGHMPSVAKGDIEFGLPADDEPVVQPQVVGKKELLHSSGTEWGVGTNTVWTQVNPRKRDRGTWMPDKIPETFEGDQAGDGCGRGLPHVNYCQNPNAMKHGHFALAMAGLTAIAMPIVYFTLPALPTIPYFRSYNITSLKGEVRNAILTVLASSVTQLSRVAVTNYYNAHLMTLYGPFDSVEPKIKGRYYKGYMLSNLAPQYILTAAMGVFSPAKLMIDIAANSAYHYFDREITAITNNIFKITNGQTKATRADFNKLQLASQWMECVPILGIAYCRTVAFRDYEGYKGNQLFTLDTLMYQAQFHILRVGLNNLWNIGRAGCITQFYERDDHDSGTKWQPLTVTRPAAFALNIFLLHLETNDAYRFIQFL